MNKKTKSQYDQCLKNGAELIEAYPSKCMYIFTMRVGGRHHLMVLDKNGTRGLSQDKYKELVEKM